MSQTTNSNNEMSFIDHLEELRWHLIRGLIAIVIIMIIVFMIPAFVFDVLIFSPKDHTFGHIKVCVSFQKPLG